MSTGHHGQSSGGINDDGKKRMDDAIKRLIAQGDGAAKRAYPEGRMSADDEGELAFAVGIQKGNVVLSFNKPVTWMGLGAADAVKLAELLIAKAKEISKEPLTVNLA